MCSSADRWRAEALQTVLSVGDGTLDLHGGSGKGTSTEKGGRQVDESRVKKSDSGQKNDQAEQNSVLLTGTQRLVAFGMTALLLMVLAIVTRSVESILQVASVVLLLLGWLTQGKVSRTRP